MLKNLNDIFKKLLLLINNDILKEIINMYFIYINILDSRGNTPLIIAVKNKNYTNIRCLFDQKDLDYRHCK